MKARNALIAVSALSLASMTPGMASPGAGEKPSAQEHRAAKGYELYSWQAVTGEWRYALVEGTNRLKDWSELEAGALPEQELHRALGKLAEGESVTWCNGQVTGQPPELAKPPESKVQSLLDLARRRGVDLDVCEPEAEL